VDFSIGAPRFFFGVSPPFAKLSQTFGFV